MRPLRQAAVAAPKGRLRQPAACLLLVTLLALTGCGTPGISRVGGGPAIAAPRPQPATDAEVKEWCEFDLERLSREGRLRVIAECRSHWGRALSQARAACRTEVNEWAKSLPRASTSNDRRAQQTARDQRVEACMRNGHDFARSMAAARQFKEFQAIEQPAAYGEFIDRHGQNDPIGLVAEAQARLAPLCGAGVSADASPAAARAWLDRFEQVGPKHCAPQQSMARRVLRRVELAQAAGDVERLDAFAARHAADDPEGLVTRARAQALELLHSEERAALERATTWAELAAFTERFSPAKDARFRLAGVAAERLAQARQAEIARIQAAPVPELDRRLQAEAQAWPAEWQDLVTARILEQSVAAGDVPAGLRVWRLAGRTDVLVKAVGSMNPAQDHDTAVEDAWRHAPQAGALRDALLAYGRKRNSFRGAMLAYEISKATADLRQAGSLAASREDKARVEHLLIERIGIERFFTTSGRLSAGHQSVDINTMNVGVGHALLGETESVLDWQVRPDSGLVPLQHGRYRLHVKLSLILDQKTTVKLLGMGSTHRDQMVLEANQSVVLDPSSRYFGKGSHRFKWAPTLQVGGGFGAFGGSVETTGMSVKVQVVSIDRLES